MVAVNEAEQDELFWALADKFVTVANELSEEHGLGIASDAMLYSALRFSTFAMAYNAESQENFAENRSEMFKFIIAQCRQMMDENLDDYTENFDEYFTEAK